MLGLTTPAVAKAGRTIPPDLLTENWIGHERHNLEWVLEQEPDLVVTTQFRDTPWDRLEETRAGFYAEWLFVRAVKDGRDFADVLLSSPDVSSHISRAELSRLLDPANYLGSAEEMTEKVLSARISAKK